MTASTVLDPALLACEVAVLRALEVAAKRAGLRAARRDVRTCNGPAATWYLREAPVPPGKIDRALDGAWDHLAVVLSGDPHAAAIATACDAYARNLLTDRVAHDRDALAAYLQVAREAG